MGEVRLDGVRWGEVRFGKMGWGVGCGGVVWSAVA